MTKDQIIGELITYQKYKLIDARIIAEVVKDVYNILIAKEDQEEATQ